MRLRHVFDVCLLTAIFQVHAHPAENCGVSSFMHTPAESRRGLSPVDVAVKR